MCKRNKKKQRKKTVHLQTDIKLKFVLIDLLLNLFSTYYHTVFNFFFKVKMCVTVYVILRLFDLKRTQSSNK